MVEVEEMNPAETRQLLGRIGYGHLGCSRDGVPYVVPVHYAWEDPDVFLLTTEGMKTEFIAANPEVCLQVEEVRGPSNWRSVIVVGRAERLSRSDDLNEAIDRLSRRNPSLSPALARTWTDSLGRASLLAVYRIRPRLLSGRRAWDSGGEAGKRADEDEETRSGENAPR